MPKRMLCPMLVAALNIPLQAARLDLALMGPGGGLPPNTIRMDVLWSMQTTDTSAHDLDAMDARFIVQYPAVGGGSLTVSSVTTIPGWTTSATSGVGGLFWEGFFLSVADLSGTGISGTGAEFTTTIASVFLEVNGDVVGTEIVFRHSNPQDPLPAVYDGPASWSLRWQYDVSGPLQFDIGVGNPGDDGRWGYSWQYSGYETYQPLVIPEPGPLALLALSALGLLRRQA